MKKFGHYGLLSLLCLVALCVMPKMGSATTDKDSWTITHSLTTSVNDLANSIVFSASRCRALYELASGTVSIQFTLSPDDKLNEAATFAVKYARKHDVCTKTSLDQESGETCKLLMPESILTSSTSPLTVTLKVNELSSATDKESCENLTETSYVYLIVNDSDKLTDSSKNVYTVSVALDFRTERPSVPENLVIGAGEVSIKVSWDAVSDASQYYVYYGQDTGMQAGDYPDQYEGLSKAISATTTAMLSSGISVGNNYDVAVVSVDKYGNESVLSEIMTVSTEAADDFWESFRKENQDVDGGFCFLATAAWGSTQEPHVSLLRQFRDEILMQNSIGRWFVRTYYKLSPPLAYFIQQHETARTISRVALWPVYGLAYAVLKAPIWAWSLFGAAFLAALGFFIRRRVKKHRLAKAAIGAAALIACCAALCGTPAEAEAKESPVDMMLEFKYGPYTPDSLGSAFETHFGDKLGYLLELEYDWQFYRGIGSLAVGFHAGYGSISGSSTTDGGESSVDETALSWVPLRISLIYRMDWLWLNLNFPFVVYAKLGFDYSFWWVTDGAGEVATDGDSKGSGGTWGWHAVAGLAFVLDWISPSMSTAIDVDWGINNSYIFVEYVYYSINNFGTGKVMDLSDKLGFQVGLAIEF